MTRYRCYGLATGWLSHIFMTGKVVWLRFCGWKWQHLRPFPAAEPHFIRCMTPVRLALLSGGFKRALDAAIVSCAANCWQMYKWLPPFSSSLPTMPDHHGRGSTPLQRLGRGHQPLRPAWTSPRTVRLHDREQHRAYAREMAEVSPTTWPYIAGRGPYACQLT